MKERWHRISRVSTESTHPSLLVRVRDPQDAEAWREFDQRYRDLVLRYSCRMGLGYWDAEEVRQLVMIRLASALRQFEYDPAKGKFRGYLARVIRSALQEHARLQDRQPRAMKSGELESLPDESSPTWEEAFESEWIMHHYRLALAKVRQGHQPRTLEVMDRILKGESPNSIASSLAMKVNAIYKTKERLRNDLRDQIASQVRDEEATPATNTPPQRSRSLE